MIATFVRSILAIQKVNQEAIDAIRDKSKQMIGN